jgi:phosphoglycerate dehydrogenase-like enzyme
MKLAMVGKYTEEIKRKIKELLPESIEVIDAETNEDLLNLTDVDCIVLRGLRINEKIIAQIPNLKFIQRWGVGYDTVDIEAAGKKGVYVSNLPGVNAHAVAEVVLTQILALYKNLLQHHNALVQGKWTKDSFNERTYTLKNKVVGLIGYGSIGKQVSKMVKGFDATVQYYDLFRLSKTVEEKDNIVYQELDDLLRTSDIVSIHVPLTENTNSLIDKQKLMLMKKNAILINTSRGGIINETDLFNSLSNNLILGAGLDCFEVEPTSYDNPLLKLHNVVLTPHIGGTSADLSDTMVPLVVDNILRLHENEELMYIVNKSYLE